MTLALQVAGAAAVLFAVQAVLVALIAAARRNANIYVTIIAVAFATAPAVAFTDLWLFGRPLAADGRLFLVLFHLALGGFLFQFMTLPDRSVTLRLFVELYLAPDGVLTFDELTARYGVRTMIGSRLDQLQAGQCLMIKSDGIVLLPRGRSFGRFVTGGRRLFRIASAN